MNGIALDDSTQNKQVQSNKEPQILTTKTIRENRAMKQETWNISFGSWNMSKVGLYGHNQSCPDKWKTVTFTFFSMPLLNKISKKTCEQILRNFCIFAF